MLRASGATTFVNKAHQLMAHQTLAIRSPTELLGPNRLGVGPPRHANTLFQFLRYQCSLAQNLPKAICSQSRSRARVHTSKRHPHLSSHLLRHVELDIYLTEITNVHGATQHDFQFLQLSSHSSPSCSRSRDDDLASSSCEGVTVCGPQNAQARCSVHSLQYQSCH